MLPLRRLRLQQRSLSLARTLGGCAAAQNSAQPEPVAAAAAAATEGAWHAQTHASPPQQSQPQQQQQQPQQPQAPPKMERKPLAPPGYSRTFYKRQLPSPPAIEFASDRGAHRRGRAGSHV